MGRRIVNTLLSKLDIHPVLIDVGASGTRPEIWEAIARHSIYVGFDPDDRDLQEVRNGRYYREIIVNKALTDDEESNTVLFYLTKSPACSSTLKPDSESLSHYLFSDLFIVEEEQMVVASSLNSIMDRLLLPGIDWFKTDSQGTDLRLFNSLKEEICSKILAVDIEPGLIDTYVGEDLFVDAHKEFSRSGFWLASLDVEGAVRMKRSTLSEVKSWNSDISRDLIEKTVKKSPGWVNARYFRTLEWLAQGDFSQRDYVLLWLFSILEHQVGFAFDLVIEYERGFGRDDICQLMRDECILQLRQLRRRIPALAKSLIPVRIKQLIKKIIF
jgi:hypothetical protein